MVVIEFVSGSKERKVSDDFRMPIADPSYGVVFDPSDNSVASRVAGFLPATGASYSAVWPGPGSYSFLTSPELIRVAAGDSDDNPSGSGARSILVSVLDENWEQSLILLSTNGTSSGAVSSFPVLRVQYAIVADIGTEGGTNQGDVTVETDSSKPLAFIRAGYSRSQQAVWSTPASTLSGYITPTIYVDGSKSVDVRLAIHTQGDSPSPTYVVGEITNITGSVPSGDSGRIALPGRTDIAVEARTSSGAQSSSVSATIDILTKTAT